MKSMLERLLKNLNNVESCTPLDALTLNSDHEIDRNGEDPNANGRTNS
jgi:hypothetical protein